MSRVCFYGSFSGWSSYPTACKRLARHLLARGVDVGLVNQREAPCDDPHLAGVRPGDPSDPIGLYHGFADGLVRVPRHRRMIGYHVGDVDVIPQTWVEPMNRLDLVITQSMWCAHVFRASGVKVPITLSRAGVDEVCAPVPAWVEPHTPLRVVHFNSSEQWWRKGTAEVIVAMQKLAGTLPLRVEVHTDHAAVRSAVTKAMAPWLSLAPPHDPLTPATMVKLLQSYDALLCPSRAEGFGAQPFEALACGLPVVATTCTGLSETLDQKTPGLVPLHAGPLGACGSFGRAPTLSPDVVAMGLRTLVGCYKELRAAARANAASVLAQWSWDTILEADHFADLVLAR